MIYRFEAARGPAEKIRRHLALSGKISRFSGQLTSPMKLPALIHHAARVLNAMYAYSPLLASLPWYAQPVDADAASGLPMIIPSSAKRPTRRFAPPTIQPFLS
jgi:hypothetical protein